MRPTDNRPLFRAIFETLRAEIRSGHIPVGARLGGEQELCARFGASRHTVREALRLLAEAGYVSRRQGAGTTVLRDRPDDQFVNSVTTLPELFQYASATRLEILSVDTLLLDEAQAGFLRAAAGDAWVRICALRRPPQEQTPLCYSEIYVPAEYGAVAEEIGVKREAVYAMLERRFGLRIVEVTQALEAVAADANIASRLDLAHGEPALLISRHYTDQEGRTVEASRNAHPARRFRYRMALQRT